MKRERLLELAGVQLNEAAGIPNEVVVNDYNSNHHWIGQCIPFSELISFEEMSECIEKSLKSER